MFRNRVEFKFQRASPGKAVRQEAAFRGFHAERVELPSGSGFDFRWRGARHYLALHDIRLRDGEIRLEGASGRSVLDLRTTLTFAPKDCTISGWSLLESRPNSYLAFTFDPALFEEEFERSLRSVDPRPLLYFSDPSLSFSLRKMKEELGLESPDLLYLETLGLWTVLEIERMARRGILHQAGAAGRLTPAAERRVRDYIQANLSREFSLYELASVTGLSRFHFSRSFRNSFGLAPRQYLMWSRVEQAKAQIIERGTSLPELAAELGFASPARLSAVFKRHVGCTIGQFRRGRVP